MFFYKGIGKYDLNIYNHFFVTRFNAFRLIV